MNYEASHHSSYSLLRIVNDLLEQWRVVAAVFVAVNAVTVVVLSSAPREYTVQSSFIPQSRKSGSSLLVLAAQLGVPGATGDVAQSPQFYVDLARSEEILGRLASQTYEIRHGGETIRGDLAKLYGIKKADPKLAWRGAVERLRSSVGTAFSPRTGVVTLRVTDVFPDLATEVNRRLLALLDAFNIETRKAQAESERRFTAERSAELKRQLAVVEEMLKKFLEANRGDFRRSPDLSLEYDRLNRELAVRQQVYMSVMQAYEQARIDEDRNTPVITIVEEPQIPQLADSRDFAGKLGVASVIGASLGILAVLLLEALRNSGEEYDRLLRNLAKIVRPNAATERNSEV